MSTAHSRNPYMFGGPTVRGSHCDKSDRKYKAKSNVSGSWDWKISKFRLVYASGFIIPIYGELKQ